MLKEVAGLLGERPILDLAPSAAAARVLRREAGIGSRTLQWFLVRHGELSDPERMAHARDGFAGTVLAVDEASMIGTVQMEKLLRIARTLEIARVVLAGDTAQLKSVTAGQPFHLMQMAGVATAVMDEVLRQKDPDLKEAVAHAREGEAIDAAYAMRSDAGGPCTRGRGYIMAGPGATQTRWPMHGRARPARPSAVSRTG